MDHERGDCYITINLKTLTKVRCDKNLSNEEEKKRSIERMECRGKDGMNLEVVGLVKLIHGVKLTGEEGEK